MAFNQISSYAIALVAAAMVVGVGALVVNGFSTGLPTQNVDSVAWNVTQYGLGGLQTFVSWFSTIVLIIVGVILLGLVLSAFGSKTGGQ